MSEPKNLYQNLDFFRIMPVGVWIYIDEPVGWDKVNIKANRDKDYFGFNYEFVDDKVQLTFVPTAGGNHIKAQYELYGGDAIIKFQYGYYDQGAQIVQFSGNINCNEFVQVEEGYQVAVEKTQFENLLRTRTETSISLSALKDLNNNDTTACEPFQLKLLSNKIVKSAKATSPPPPADPPALAEVTAARVAYIQIDTTESVTSEAQELFLYPAGVTNDSPKTEDRYTYKATEAGLCKIITSGSFKLSALTATFDFNPVGKWKITPYIRVVRAGVEVLTFILDSLAISGDTGFGINLITNYTWNLNGLKVYLEAGDELYWAPEFSWYYFQLGIPTPHFSIKRIRIENMVSSFEVIQETVASSSSCTVYNLFKTITHLVKCATGRDNAVVSNFFGPGGAAEKYCITNGYQIRQFSVAERPPQWTIDKCLKTMSAIWCISLTYSVDSLGNDVIKIEPIKEIFGTKKILNIRNVYDYSERHAKEFTYNEYEIGYEKFENDQAYMIDEYNTLHKGLFPIRTYKAKYSKKCPAIGSGHTAEQQRREQFAETPSTSLTYDDEIFIFNYADPKIFKGVSFSVSVQLFGTAWKFGRSLGLTAGDRFKILNPSSSNFNITFTISSVRYDGGDEYYLTDGTPVIEALISDVQILGGALVATNEDFEIVTGVNSPETSYNLRISPKRMVYNHSFLFNIGLAFKSNSDQIIVTEVKDNGELTTKLLASASLGLLEQNYTLKEKDPITLSNFNMRKAPAVPRMASFKADMTFDEIAFLKKRLRGETNTDEDFGMIAHIDLNGDYWESHVWALEYDPVKQTATFEVLKVNKI